MLFYDSFWLRQIFILLYQNLRIDVYVRIDVFSNVQSLIFAQMKVSEQGISWLQV